MSVLVKGWSIPTDGCCGCYFRTEKYCGILSKNERVLEYAERFTRPDNCPLVELPDHGDLIDAEEQMRLMWACEYDTYDDYNRAFDMLDNAPTIISAERKE